MCHAQRSQARKVYEDHCKKYNLKVETDLCKAIDTTVSLAKVTRAEAFLLSVMHDEVLEFQAKCDQLQELFASFALSHTAVDNIQKAIWDKAQTFDQHPPEVAPPRGNKISVKNEAGTTKPVTKLIDVKKEVGAASRPAAPARPPTGRRKKA